MANEPRLYDQLSKALDKHPGSARTLDLANRLEAALFQSGEADAGAIFAEECRSLVAEAKGDLQNAIKHREEEIRRIRRLHDISRGTPTEPFAFDQYSYSDLCDALGMLAVLYHENGDVQKAVRLLEEARQICRERGIDFDAEDILREYADEQLSKNR